MYDAFHDDAVSHRLAEAEALKWEGRYEEALSILEILILDDPTNVTALEEVADNELNLEHIERAERAAKRAISLDKESYMAHYVLGFASSRKHDWQKAVRHLQKGNKLQPNNPEILRCLGYALFHDGRQTEGIVTLERSLNLDENNDLILCDLGVAHLTMRNVDKAMLLFQKALAIDPENERAQRCAAAVTELRKKMTRLAAGS